DRVPFSGALGQDDALDFRLALDDLDLGLAGFVDVDGEPGAAIDDLRERRLDREPFGARGDVDRALPVVDAEAHCVADFEDGGPFDDGGDAAAEAELGATGLQG